MSGALDLRQLTADEARTLTDEVRDDAAALWAKLLQLYDGGAHTALGYTSWGAYYEEEFGESATKAYRLLRAARVVAELPIGNSPQLPTGQLPANEAQARELARVAPEERAAVMEAASADGPPTAASIRAAARPAPSEPAPPEQASLRATEPVAAPVVMAPPPPPDVLAARERRHEVESIGSSLKVVGDAVFALRRPDSDARVLAHDFSGPLVEEARASVGLPTYPITPEGAREAAAFLLALADYLEGRNGNGS